MGESKGGPQGVQEDLDSSIISESQAAAMSPDYWFPLDPSLAPSLYLFLPLPLVDYGTVPGLWLQRYGRGQIQTHPHAFVHTDAPCEARTRAHNNPQTGSGASPPLIWLLHMFSTRVKILPERHVKAEASTLGELNYLSDVTFSFFNLTLTCIRACADALQSITEPHGRIAAALV